MESTAPPSAPNEADCSPQHEMSIQNDADEVHNVIEDFEGSTLIEEEHQGFSSATSPSTSEAKSDRLLVVEAESDVDGDTSEIVAVSFAKDHKGSKIDVTDTAAKVLSTPPEILEQEPPASAQSTSNSVRMTKMSKVKKPGILHGLDSQNIIEVSDEEADTDIDESVPPSTYTTRAQVKGGRRDDLCYDQRYHPVDEVIRPSQAARVRQQYEAGGFSDSEGDDMDIDTDTDSGEEAPAMKRKCTKISKPITAPTRRSSRVATQPEVVYDQRIHPQDLEMMELGILRRKRSVAAMKDEDQDIDDDENAEAQANDTESVSLSSDVCISPAKGDKKRKRAPGRHEILYYAEGLDVYFMEPGERYFPHERDSVFSGGRPTCGFTIHEEPLAVQLATVANAPAPTEFDDYAKENVPEPSSRSEPLPDPLSGTTIVSANTLANDPSLNVHSTTEGENDIGMAGELIEQVLDDEDHTYSEHDTRME